MRKNTQIVFFAFIGIVVLFLLYWLLIRPAQIKHECAWSGGKFVPKAEKIIWVSDGHTQASSQQYESCLHDKGL